MVHSYRPTRKWFIRANAFSLLSLLLPLTGFATEPTPTPDQLLASLKANDSQFQNVLLEYDYASYRTVITPPRFGPLEWVIDESVDREDLPAKAYLAEIFNRYLLTAQEIDDGQIPENDRRWVEHLRAGRISFHAKHFPAQSRLEKTEGRDLLALRWPDIAVYKQFVNGAETRFSVIDNKSTIHYASTGLSTQYVDNSANDAPDVYQRYAINAKFALGIGYSDVIREIESITLIDGMYHVVANIDWWGVATGHASFVIEPHSLIMRRAEAWTQLDHMIVTTAEEHRSPEGDVCCAKNGTLKITSNWQAPTHFEISLLSLTPRLSDQQFMEIAELGEPMSDTQQETEAKDGKKTTRKFNKLTPELRNQAIFMLSLVGIMIGWLIKRRIFPRRLYLALMA